MQNKSAVFLVCLVLLLQKKLTLEHLHKCKVFSVNMWCHYINNIERRDIPRKLSQMVCMMCTYTTIDALLSLETVISVFKVVTKIYFGGVLGDDTARPEGGIGFLGRSSKPPAYQLEVWGSDVSSPSQIWGKAPAEIYIHCPVQLSAWKISD